MARIFVAGQNPGKTSGIAGVGEAINNMASTLERERDRMIAKDIQQQKFDMERELLNLRREENLYKRNYYDQMGQAALGRAAAANRKLTMEQEANLAAAGDARITALNGFQRMIENAEARINAIDPQYRPAPEWLAQFNEPIVNFMERLSRPGADLSALRIEGAAISKDFEDRLEIELGRVKSTVLDERLDMSIAFMEEDLNDLGIGRDEFTRLISGKRNTPEEKEAIIEQLRVLREEAQTEQFYRTREAELLRADNPDGESFRDNLDKARTYDPDLEEDDENYYGGEDAALLAKIQSLQKDAHRADTRKERIAAYRQLIAIAGGGRDAYQVMARDNALIAEQNSLLERAQGRMDLERAMTDGVTAGALSFDHQGMPTELAFMAEDPYDQFPAEVSQNAATMLEAMNYVAASGQSANFRDDVLDRAIEQGFDMDAAGLFALTLSRLPMDERYAKFALGDPEVGDIPLRLQSQANEVLYEQDAPARRGAIVRGKRMSRQAQEFSDEALAEEGKPRMVDPPEARRETLADLVPGQLQDELEDPRNRDMLGAMLGKEAPGKRDRSDEMDLVLGDEDQKRQATELSGQMLAEEMAIAGGGERATFGDLLASVPEEQREPALEASNWLRDQIDKLMNIASYKERQAYFKREEFKRAKEEAKAFAFASAEKGNFTALEAMKDELKAEKAELQKAIQQLEKRGDKSARVRNRISDAKKRLRIINQLNLNI